MISSTRRATRHKLIATMRVPKLAPHQPRFFSDDEDRWALVRRLLHDDEVRLSDRVAGALVLLYAQLPARIVNLTVDDIVDRSTTPRLRMARELITLPEPLGSLACQLPDHLPTGMAGYLANDVRWLFPGRQPDRPMHAASLGRRLARLGIEPRAHRNTALLQLAGELPIPVLADLLGLHLGTAQRWADTAAGNWTAYAAIRAQ